MHPGACATSNEWLWLVKGWLASIISKPAVLLAASFSQMGTRDDLGRCPEDWQWGVGKPFNIGLYRQLFGHQGSARTVAVSTSTAWFDVGALRLVAEAYQWSVSDTRTGGIDLITAWAILLERLVAPIVSGLIEGRLFPDWDMDFQWN